MRQAAFALILLTAVAGTSEAQGRGRANSAQGIPPGQMPRAGECRVWHDNLPPGRQPAPTSCDQAERVASRSRDARVIYGDDRRAGRNRDERYRDRTTGTSRYPEVYRSYPNDRGYANNSVPFQVASVTVMRRAARTRATTIPTIRFATAGIARAIVDTTTATEPATPTSWSIATASNQVTSAAIAK